MAEVRTDVGRGSAQQCFQRTLGRLVKPSILEWVWPPSRHQLNVLVEQPFAAKHVLTQRQLSHHRNVSHRVDVVVKGGAIDMILREHEHSRPEMEVLHEEPPDEIVLVSETGWLLPAGEQHESRRFDPAGGKNVDLRVDKELITRQRRGT